ncbi:MAG: hypothetical protein ACI8RH_001431, partial [Flavobacteriales bacterium]
KKWVKITEFQMSTFALMTLEASLFINYSPTKGLSNNLMAF